MRVAKWLVGGVLALLLLLLVAGNIFGQYLLGYTREHFPMPGKLIASIVRTSSLSLGTERSPRLHEAAASESEDPDSSWLQSGALATA